MIYTIIQIIIALVLISLMGIIAYGIYNKDVQEIVLDILKPNTVKKKTKIIDGVFPYQQQAIFNTTDASNGTYVDVNPSVNQAGGAVYSYNFWLFIPEEIEGSDSTNKTLTLFTKGSNNIIKYKSPFRCNTHDSGWFLSKNPLVRLDFNNRKVDAIIVEFNSISNPDVYHAGASLAEQKCGSGNHVNYDENLFGIKNLRLRGAEITDKWNMVTIVVSETTSEPNNVFLSSNQVIVKLYLNGYRYLDKNGEIVLNEGSLSTAIKSNRGNLILNPGHGITDNLYIKQTDKNIAISDLTYFNYTLTDLEVTNLFKQGCNKKIALLPSEKDFNSVGFDEALLEISGSRKLEAL